MNSIKNLFPEVAGTNIAEFQTMLKNFDWSYSYSDDHSVYKRGAKQEEEIDNLLKLQPELQKVYDEYKQNRDVSNAAFQAEQLAERMRVKQEQTDYCLMPILQNWYLEDLENGIGDMRTPTGLIVVYGANGEFNTTRIVSVKGTMRDPFIVTKSGSKYRLGVPHTDLNKHMFRSIVYDTLMPISNSQMGFDVRVFTKPKK